MADEGHYHSFQMDRREHNDVAMAKRVLQVLFDYASGEYKVPGIDEGNNATVKEKNSDEVSDRLSKIESILKLLLHHAELVTGHELREHDLGD